MSQSVLKLILAFFLLIIFFLLLAPKYSSLFTSKPDSLTLAVGLQPAFALIFVAEDQGYFKDQNLNLTYTKHILGKDALDDVLSDRADLATVFDIAALHQLFDGKSLGAITTLHWSNANTALVLPSSLKSAGLAGLKGKKIAVTRGTSTEYFLNSLLFSEGLRKADFNLVNLSPENSSRSLANNTVDAAVMFNPYLSSILLTNPEKYTSIYSNTYTEISLLVGQKSYLAASGPQLVRLLKALARAQEFILKNPTETQNIINSWVSTEASPSPANFLSSYDFSLKLTNRLYTILSREADFLYQNTPYPSALTTLRSFFITDYLKLASPASVTLY